jgi:hypothetical protein
MTLLPQLVRKLGLNRGLMFLLAIRQPHCIRAIYLSIAERVWCSIKCLHFHKFKDV